jgi:hypothetical protein
MSNDNVIAFPGSSISVKQPDVSFDEPPVVDMNVNPDEEMEEVVLQLINLLKERKGSIRSFICAIAIDEGEEMGTACHTLTSPIEPSEYALLLKMLEGSFQRRLNGMRDS